MRVEKLEVSMQVFEQAEEVPEKLSRLLEASKEAMKAAYAPFSGFKVGSAVLLENGTIVHGCNQENASYPEGLCAERVALYAAGANHPGQAPVAIAITCSHTAGTVLSPCGGCRQVMMEFENRFQRKIELVTTDGEGTVYVIPSVSQLLPWGFDRKVLDLTDR